VGFFICEPIPDLLSLILGTSCSIIPLRFSDQPRPGFCHKGTTPTSPKGLVAKMAPVFLLKLETYQLLPVEAFALRKFDGVRSDKESVVTHRRMAWGIQRDRRQPQAARAAGTGHPRNGCKAVSGVACPKGVEGLGMAGLIETLGSPWPPLAICLCRRPLPR
jgi:hypothetical protein